MKQTPLNQTKNQNKVNKTKQKQQTKSIARNQSKTTNKTHKHNQKLKLKSLSQSKFQSKSKEITAGKQSSKAQPTKVIKHN